MAPLRYGKDTLKEALRMELGYSHHKAAKIVDQFIEILKKALGEHKAVDLGPIGVLKVVQEKPYRTHSILKNFKGQAPTTIRTRYKHKYRVKLKTKVKFVEGTNA